MSTTTGHKLNPRSAAAYAAALRTIPSLAWAKSIANTETDEVVIRVRRVLEDGVELSVEFTTVEECVAAIHEATERD